MYHVTLVHLHFDYTSSAILIPCYHLTRRESFYGDLMPLATIKHK